jgi:hypothetical protein
VTSEDRFEVHNVNHAVSGDIIQQYGSANIGKQVHNGSGDNVAGSKSSSGQGYPPPQSVIIRDGDYVARDKNTTQFGDVSHTVSSGPDGSMDSRVE